ncbi:MAG: hypothetical protein M3R02_01515 [Chloroflexota bacterium]|nr:hypothetical protein [Chloroflexota bacterium]
MTKPDVGLAITFEGRTWDLTAYAIDDLGVWDAVAVERGTGGPALPAAEWGVTRAFASEWRTLSALAEAIIRRAAGDPRGSEFWHGPLVDREPVALGPEDFGAGNANADLLDLAMALGDEDLIEELAGPDEGGEEGDGDGEG